MNPLILGPVLELAKSFLDRWFPNAEERSKREAELMILLQTQDFQKVLAQIEVNGKEAASPNLFVSGARPFVMWICGVGFLWATIGQPIAAWYAATHGMAQPPDIDADVLMYVLGGLLGLGGFRSYEKTKGVATK